MAILEHVIGKRLEQGRRFVFVPEILELRSNFDPIYSFVYGIAPGWGNGESLPRSQITLHWEVTDELKPPARNAGAAEYMGRRIPGGREARMLFEWDDLNPRLFTNTEYVFWASLRGTASHQLPGQILSDVASAALLTNSLVPIHCSAVARGGRTIMILAPSNTGKTTTAWKLVSDHGYSFIAEDIAISDGSSVFGAPYTGTGLPRPFDLMRPPLHERMRRLMFPIWLKESLARQLQPHQIEKSAPIGPIVFLQRGKESITDVDPGEAADLMLRNNRLEFRYATSPHLLQTWYNTGSPNLSANSDTEKFLLNELVSNAERLVRISAPDPEGFAQQVLDLLHS